MITQVHTIQGRLSNAFLLETHDALMLVDTGIPTDYARILATVRAARDKKLRLIYLTHGHIDHSGSAAALRNTTGAPIAIHQADAADLAAGKTIAGSARSRGVLMLPILAILNRLGDYLGVRPDIKLDDGDKLADFGFNATVCHSPGHTMGSSCLVVDDEHAFVGDLLTNRRRPRPQRLYAQDWRLLQESLQRLQSIKAELFYFGHGKSPATRAQLNRELFDKSSETKT